MHNTEYVLEFCDEFIFFGRNLLSLGEQESIILCVNSVVVDSFVKFSACV